MPDANCSNCDKPFSDGQHIVEVNPNGGYGFPRIVVCDYCLVTAYANWYTMADD